MHFKYASIMQNMQVLFFGFTYKIYSYIQCNVVCNWETKYPQSYNHNFVFFDCFEKFKYQRNVIVF